MLYVRVCRTVLPREPGPESGLNDSMNCRSSAWPSPLPWCVSSYDTPMTGPPTVSVTTNTPDVGRGEEWRAKAYIVVCLISSNHATGSFVRMMWCVKSPGSQVRRLCSGSPIHVVDSTLVAVATCIMWRLKL